MSKNDQIAALIENPGKVADLLPEAIPVLMAQLAAIQSVLAARLLEESRFGKVESPTENSPDKLISVPDAAERLSFTEQYLYHLIKRGSLAAVKQGKYIRIRERELSAWIERHTEKAVDKELYHQYSMNHESQRTPRNKKATRIHPGADGRPDRGSRQHRSAMGKGRVEDIRTRLKVDPPDIPNGNGIPN